MYNCICFEVGWTKVGNWGTAMSGIFPSSNAAAAIVLLMGTTAGGVHAALAAAVGLVDGTPISRIVTT